VPDHPDIFVVGDMGEVASEGEVLPQLGSVAMQSGTHVGKQIARLILGNETQPFKYWDKGFMATIGRGSAVVEFPNKRTLAWSTRVFRLARRSPGVTKWNAKQDRDAMELGLVSAHARPRRTHHHR